MSKENRVSDERLEEIRVQLIKGRQAVTFDENLMMVWELQSLRSKPVAGVEVKPLEWHGNTGRAGTAFRYVIAEPDRTIGWRVWVSIGDQSPSFFLTAKPENRKAAVSFAEANYRQRILSTLSLPAQEPVAWRWKHPLWPNDHWQYGTHDPRIGTDDGVDATPLYAAPQPEAIITEEMVERAVDSMNVALRSPLPENGASYQEIGIRAALTAALVQP